VIDRGEGANHGIVDVAEFAKYIAPTLLAGGGGVQLRKAIDEYENVVSERSRPGVLVSRRACLDAHEWSRLDARSPLLSPRIQQVKYDEENDCLVHG
jgi:hypothetical protein